MPPSVIIDSGNGLRPLWAVAREPLTPEALARVEAENRAVEAALGAAGTHDVSRLLRLPGTMNFPNRTKLARGRGVARARVLFQGGRAYPSGDAARLGPHLAGLLAGKGLLRLEATQDGAEGGGGASDALMDRLRRAAAPTRPSPGAGLATPPASRTQAGARAPWRWAASSSARVLASTRRAPCCG